MFKSFIQSVVKAVWMFVIIPLCLMVANVFVGALSGWFIGLFFGNAILNVLDKIGVCDVSMWQLGAFIGFVSSFFKHLITFNDKRKSKA